MDFLKHVVEKNGKGKSVKPVPDPGAESNKKGPGSKAR